MGIGEWDLPEMETELPYPLIYGQCSGASGPESPPACCSALMHFLHTTDQQLFLPANIIFKLFSYHAFRWN